MGYTTEFRGSFNFDPPLTHEQRLKLQDFADARHGGNTKEHDYAPSFYCQWVPTRDGTQLQWDGGEKFYEYAEWLEVLNDRFFKPWGVKLFGTVKYQGEDFEDRGVLVAEGNSVTKQEEK